MGIRDRLSQSLYSWTSGDGTEILNLTWGGILGILFSIIIIVAVTRLSFIGLNSYRGRHKMKDEAMSKVKRMIYVGMTILFALLSLLSLGYNPAWFFTDGISLSVRDVLIVGLSFVGARIADTIISARLLEEFDSQTQRDIYEDQYGQKNESNITGVVRSALLIGVGIILTRVLGFRPLQVTEKLSISLSQILTVILIILITRLIIWVIINIILYGWYKTKKIDLGKQYSYNILLSYVIYFIAGLIALQSLKIDLTLILAGAAALLVGVGIALQQVFSDFFSGLVILFERSVEVGDFLDLGSERGTVKKIGLRASVLETPERKDVIVPNSQLVNTKVANWSSSRTLTRFDVAVGVAYGSDTVLVKRLLVDAAIHTNGILTVPSPFVRLISFGASSLDFLVLFYSERHYNIEDVKSNLRLEIDRLFKENEIKIPFPQRRVHVDKPEDPPV